jgi:hypothetical protein
MLDRSVDNLISRLRTGIGVFCKAYRVSRLASVLFGRLVSYSQRLYAKSSGVKCLRCA